MSDLVAAEAQWHGWIEQACAAVGVDPALVDVPMIHALTKDIAHDFARPMAPVGSFILGVALGQAAASGMTTADDSHTSSGDLLARLRATLVPAS
ncbi:MAG: DUF6457 domain-containing protein [Actinobacteria bacterium]|jgi:hypothetical protein|nr:DUF6457 domain-containing protein [Actinomycetota bacterium]